MPATLLGVTAGFAGAAVTAAVAKIDGVAAASPSASSTASSSSQQQLLRGRGGLRSINSWRGSSLRSDHGFCPLQQAKAAVSDSSRRVRGVVRVQAWKQPPPHKLQRHEERAVRTKAAVNVENAESAAVTDESTDQGHISEVGIPSER